MPKYTRKTRMRLFKPKEEPMIPLPTDAETLQVWMKTIIETHNLPDNDNTRDAICTQVMHLNQNVSSAPLSFFANVVKKSMANKAAYDQLAVYREARIAAEKAKAAAKAEADLKASSTPAPTPSQTQAQSTPATQDTLKQ